MAYIVKLKCSDSVWDERQVTTDEELFSVLGKFSIWYFLALDSCDYKDARTSPADALLAFTCDKPDDEPGYSRHGLPKGMLAYGYAWPQGRKEKARIYVKRL